jgi:hypothetical protein
MLEKRERIALGFAGTRREAGLVWCTPADPSKELKARLGVLAYLEAQGKDRVSHENVRQAVMEARSAHDIERFLVNPLGWRPDMRTWQSEFGRIRGEELVQSLNQAQMEAAVDGFLTAFEGGEFLPEDNPELLGHLQNMRTRATEHGQRLEPPRPGHPISLAQAAILAYEAAATMEPRGGILMYDEALGRYRRIL